MAPASGHWSPLLRLKIDEKNIRAAVAEWETKPNWIVNYIKMPVYV